jgi:hypothetical protein
VCVQPRSLSLKIWSLSRSWPGWALFIDISSLSKLLCVISKWYRESCALALWFVTGSGPLINVQWVEDLFTRYLRFLEWRLVVNWTSWVFRWWIPPVSEILRFQVMQNITLYSTSITSMPYPRVCFSHSLVHDVYASTLLCITAKWFRVSLDSYALYLLMNLSNLNWFQAGIVFFQVFVVISAGFFQQSIRFPVVAIEGGQVTNGTLPRFSDIPSCAFMWHSSLVDAFRFFPDLTRGSVSPWRIPCLVKIP